MNRLRIQLILAGATAVLAACHQLQPERSAPVEVLTRRSPCDILPEHEPVIGQLASQPGYPRWNGHAVVFDTTNPHRKPDTSVVRNLTGTTMFGNEIHDCQRLVLAAADTLAYGPLVGLLPIDDAMKVDDTAFDGGRTVATVYNWGGANGEKAEYAQLDIEYRRNCLWLRRVNGADWRAAMTSHTQGPCFTHAAPGLSSYTLQVQRAFHTAPMPGTARWEWSESDSVQLIGIKCGTAWCRIGPSTVRMADSIDLGPGAAHSTIPGYFDVQHLALPGGSLGVIPGPLAVVTPMDTFFTVSQTQLALIQQGSTMDVMEPAFTSGLDVATIDLVDPGLPTPATYRGEWGLDERPVRMHMRRYVLAATSDTSTFIGPANQRGRVVSPFRIDNTLHAPLGAVRWRWHDTANTLSLWSACGSQGMDCCDTR